MTKKTKVTLLDLIGETMHWVRNTGSKCTYLYSHVTVDTVDVENTKNTAVTVSVRILFSGRAFGYQRRKVLASDVGLVSYDIVRLLEQSRQFKLVKARKHVTTFKPGLGQTEVSFIVAATGRRSEK